MEHISQALIQVANQELAKPEPTKQVTGEEAKFLECLEDKRITANSLEELKEVLRLVMVKIGLRAQNWPSEIEKAVLVTHIIEYFGGHTRKEILLAFDMAIAGKLTTTDRDGKDEMVSANCYENFSCLYFSNVMNAYRLWASEVYKQNKKDLPMLPESKEDLGDLAMEDWMSSVSLNIQKGNYDVELVPEMLYKWMDDKGRIVKSAAEKNEYLLKAVAHRQGRLAASLSENESNENKKTFAEFMEMNNSGCFTGSEVDRIKKIAKKMILFDMLNSEPK